MTISPTDAETTYASVQPLGNGPVLFVGREGGYEARSLVRFALTDTLVARYGASTLTLTLQSAEPRVPVRFRLFRVSQFWNEPVVTWERANTDSAGDVAWDRQGGLFAPLALAEAGPCSLASDTVRIRFSLSPETTTRIFEDRARNYGFLVALEDEGFAQRLWRFYSRENAVNLRPQWEVAMVDTGGNDTTKVLFCAADASIVRRVAAEDRDRLLVGSGVTYRSLIRFPLPEDLDSTVTINRATLWVYCDTTRTFLETKTMQVHLVTGSWNGDSTAVEASALSQALAVPGTSAITFDVSRALSSWVTGATPNNGLMLRFATETSTVSYCPLFGATGPATRAPRLEIQYTKPPRPPGMRTPARGGTEEES